MQAAADPHGRVRLEVITTASWLPKDSGLAILNEAAKKPIDDWMQVSYETAFAHLNGRSATEKQEEKIKTKLKGPARDLYVKGKAIYAREGFCITCHQPDGNGLSPSGFPPLKGTKWVTGNEERLIKIILKGLHGPIEVNGQKYAGQVPMTPFGGMLKDDEVAAIATYVRNSFGNSAVPVSAEKVKTIRAATKAKTGFYAPSELLKLHPMEK